MKLIRLSKGFMAVAEISDTISQMPSIRQLIMSVVEDLSQERSVLLLTPDYTDTEFIWHEARNYLSRDRHFEITEIESPNGLSEFDSIPKFIAQYFWEDRSCHHTSDLLDLVQSRLFEPSSIGDIVYVRNVDSEEISSKWASFISEWAQLCQDLPNSIVFCLISPAKSLKPYPPKEEVKLVIHTWW